MSTRVRVVEFERSRQYLYTVIDVEENGRVFRTILSFEYETRGGFSQMQLHCDCKEFRERGLCRHILTALSVLASQQPLSN